MTPAEAVTDIHYQCPLDKESRKLTTFVTPFGRFKYLRAPYGILSISEHYNRRMDEAFARIQGIRRIVDDVVVFDKDEQQHVERVKEILRHCREEFL